MVITSFCYQKRKTKNLITNFILLIILLFNLFDDDCKDLTVRTVLTISGELNAHNLNFVKQAYLYYSLLVSLLVHDSSSHAVVQ